MIAWLMHHRRAFITTMAQMGSTPVASLFTLFAIGVALSLPVGMFVLFNNATQIAGTLPVKAEITVFMRDEADSVAVAAMQQRLKAMPGMSSIQFVSKKDALLDLSKQMGMAELATELPQNPLPDAWVITPASTDVNATNQLMSKLRELPDTALVQADHQWAQRLDAILSLVQQVISMLAIILGIALIAISGNTIRLQIITRHAEIEVSLLIGATDRFIRRPFLYFGAVQGLIGGLVAWGVVSIGIAILAPHVSTLSQMYDSQIQLQNLDFVQAAILLIASSILGWVGAYAGAPDV